MKIVDAFKHAVVVRNVIARAITAGIRPSDRKKLDLYIQRFGERAVSNRGSRLYSWHEISIAPKGSQWVVSVKALNNSEYDHQMVRPPESFSSFRDAAEYAMTTFGFTFPAYPDDFSLAELKALREREKGSKG